MLSHEHATELIGLIDGLRQRIGALDVAATGICAGMRQNTIGGEAAYQLLDVIAADLKARADAALRLLATPAMGMVTQRAGVIVPVSAAVAGRGSPPMPASSALAR